MLMLKLATACSSFFFSSRRRHTRWPRDWSSDVCSSDLVGRSVALYELDQRLFHVLVVVAEIEHAGAGKKVNVRLAVFIQDRKSTRLNSSHVAISYAVFCLKKKKMSNICNLHRMYYGMSE